MENSSGFVIRALPIFLFLLICLSSSAQSDDWFNRFGYIGNNAVRPGAFFGMEYKPSIFRTKSNGKKKFFTRSYDAYVSGLYHNKNQLVFANYYRVKWTTSNDKGMRMYTAFGPGVQRSFFPETYEFVNGQVEQKRLAGRTYLMLNAALGADYGGLKNGEAKIMTELSFNVLFDYNAGVVPFVNLKIGLIR